METPTACDAIYFNSKAVVADSTNRVKTNISCSNWISEFVLFNFASISGYPCKHLEYQTKQLMEKIVTSYFFKVHNFLFSY